MPTCTLHTHYTNDTYDIQLPFFFNLEKPQDGTELKQSWMGQSGAVSEITPCLSYSVSHI